MKKINWYIYLISEMFPSWHDDALMKTSVKHAALLFFGIGLSFETYNFRVQKNYTVYVLKTNLP
jgi:hypothetical protein